MTTPLARPHPLTLAVLLALSAGAPANPAPTPQILDRIEVREQAIPDPRYPQIAREVEDGKIKSAKKSTRIEVDAMPAVAANNLRQFFARTPGLLVSEIAQPGIFNLNYRGLGDPHESEFVTVLENGLPIASDWFGYPTLYYLPGTGRVQRIEMLRGGSALVYGPQPGPSINLVTRQPQFASDTRLSTSQLAGSDGLYQGFTEISGGNERLAWLVDHERRSYDSPRRNGDYQVNSARAVLAWQATEHSRWLFEASGYESDNGEPGRLSGPRYEADRDQTTTPFNRLWVDRWNLRIGNQTELADGWTLDAVLSRGYLDRLSRRSSAFVPPQNPPSSTALDRQEFNHTAFDLRLAGDFGENHTLATGLTLYRDDSPRDRRTSTDVTGARSGDGSLAFQQERESRYAAVFAEAVLRFDDWRVVPGVRIDRMVLDIDETLIPASANRELIDREFGRTETLFGLGVSRDFADNHQFYANASQAYRPMRFDDVANPTAALGENNAPDPARALNFEAGFRGQATSSLYYDVSAFRIDFEDKIEQRQLSPSDIRRINSGDARHQGLEASLEWELFAGALAEREDSLVLYTSAAWLDAEIVRSENATLEGNTPGFAPEWIWRAGLVYRSGEGMKLALTGTHVSEHYWQDSNRAGGSASQPIPAEIPAYTVVDLSAEVPINTTLALQAGVNNLFDQRYYSRVRSDGIEPATERNWYAGVKLRF
jgi:Fe(3+) dicitrate transport protein